jgi:hypothetical protein
MNMTDEEILSAAVSVGLLNDCLDVETMSFCILAFAKFVGEIERFKEREDCAKVCDDEWDGDADTYEYSIAANDCAAAIRARGEA